MGKRGWRPAEDFPVSVYKIPRLGHAEERHWAPTKV